MREPVSRRAFVGVTAGLLTTLSLSGCATAPEEKKSIPETKPVDEAVTPSQALPAPAPDPESPFGVDKNVNMQTIDSFLESCDFELRDMRMLKDPANYAELGGNADLDMTIEGAKIVPYPYIGTLQELPVPGAYEGDRLFDVTWAEDGTVASAKPRYEQSMQIIEDLFPQDRPIVLMCGGGGYAGMMHELLKYLGWDESLLYNAGGEWDYTGYHALQLISYDEAGSPTFYSWRANYAPINFDELTQTKA